MSLMQLRDRGPENQSTLLKSSKDLGWSTLTADLLSHSPL